MSGPFAETQRLPAEGLLVSLGGRGRPVTLTTAFLSRALDRWESPGGPRWVAFTGNHPSVFLAGAHFDELLDLKPFDALDFARRGQALFARMRRSPVWFVACISGACLGGGLDFALACDYRVAATGALMGHPGPRLGFFTGWGGTVSLPRRGGASRAALLGARSLDASEALGAGWIEEVAPDPLAIAVRRARASAGLDLAAVKAMAAPHGLPAPARLRREKLLRLAWTTAPV
jgi:3-hydroxyacyl-CoA dehydrogenase/enoyl-CoA hydratase/3-hydroxybutyryl-CoA epimerase